MKPRRTTTARRSNYYNVDIMKTGKDDVYAKAVKKAGWGPSKEERSASSLKKVHMAKNMKKGLPSLDNKKNPDNMADAFKRTKPEAK